MAGKGQTLQSVKAVGDAWIVCRSKKYAERIYYFNTETGQAVWNLSEAELRKAQYLDSLAAGRFPEPKEPPSDSTGPMPTFLQPNFRHIMAPPKVYEQQIINNQYIKPFLFPQYTQHYYQERPQYNPNVWAMPPPFVGNGAALPTSQPVLMGAFPMTSNQFTQDYLIPPSVGTSFSNQFGPSNSFSNNSQAIEPARIQPVIADPAASQIDVLAKHGVTRIKLSDRFKPIANYGGKAEKLCETVTNNSNVVDKVLDVKDLRQVLNARRNETILCKSSSIGVENSTHEQEDIEDDVHEQMEYLQVESSIQTTLANETASISTEDDDDKWLSENLQLQGTKAVIDVTPLRTFLECPKGNWILVPDVTVLLKNLTFLNVLCNSDPHCQLVIPSRVYSSLQNIARGVLGSPGGGGQTGTGAARTACRVINQLLNTERAIIDHREASTCCSAIEDCCLSLKEQKLPFIAISNNRGLISKMNAVHTIAFTVEDIKECLSQNRPEFESENVQLPMTITFSNNEAASPTFVTQKDAMTYAHDAHTEKDDSKKQNIQEDRTKMPETKDSTKKMVNAEVQTDIFIPIDNKTLTKHKISEVADQLIAKKIEENTANKIKSRGLVLKRNTVAQNSLLKTNNANPIEKKIRWWRRRNYDTIRKPIATNPVVTSEEIQKLIELAIAENPKAVDSQGTTDTISHENHQGETPQNRTKGSETIAYSEHASSSVDSKANNANNKVDSAQNKSKPTEINTRSTQAATDVVKPIIKPAKLILTRSQQLLKPQTELRSTQKVLSTQLMTTKAKTLLKPQTELQPTQKMLSTQLMSTRSKTLLNSQTELQSTQKVLSTQLMSTRAKTLLNPQTELQSTEKVLSTQLILTRAQTLLKTETELQSTQGEVLSTQTKQEQKIDELKSKKATIEKIIVKSPSIAKPERSKIQPTLHVSTPTKNIIKPTLDKKICSPKKMRDFNCQIDSVVHTRIEESASSSDVISNTRSSASSEQSSFLQQSITNNKESRDPKMFVVTDDAMAESLKNGSDEWISRFVQIMEEVFAQVLEFDPSKSQEMPPPWTMTESAECIKRNYNTNLRIRKSATDFTAALFQVLDDRGNMRRDLTPSRFLEIFSHAVNFVLELQITLPNCEDIQIGLKSLQQLLSDIERYSSDESPEFDDNDTLNDSYKVTSLEGDDYSGHGSNKKELQKNTKVPPLKKLQDEMNTAPSKITFVRKFNIDDSFEEFMEKRKKLSPKEVFANPNKQIKNKNQIQEMKVTKNTKNLKNIQESAQSKTNDVKSTQKGLSPKFTSPFLTSSPITRTNFQTPEEKLNLKEKETLDMDLLDYSEDLAYSDNYDYLDEKFDSIKNVDYFTKDTFVSFHDEPSFHQSKAMENQNEYTTVNNLKRNMYNSHLNGESNKSMVDDQNDKKILVSKFLKEMKDTFQRVNNFCETAYGEISATTQLPDARQHELREQACDAQCHIANLLNTLERIFNRESSCSDLPARNCVGTQMSYKDIIDRCKSQAKIFDEALTSINGMLDILSNT